jgi:hypothetical protein
MRVWSWCRAHAMRSMGAPSPPQREWCDAGSVRGEALTVWPVRLDSAASDAPGTSADSTESTAVPRRSRSPSGPRHSRYDSEIRNSGSTAQAESSPMSSSCSPPITFASPTTRVHMLKSGTRLRRNKCRSRMSRAVHVVRNLPGGWSDRVGTQSRRAVVLELAEERSDEPDWRHHDDCQELDNLQHNIDDRPERVDNNMKRPKDRVRQLAELLPRDFADRPPEGSPASCASVSCGRSAAEASARPRGTAASDSRSLSRRMPYAGRGVHLRRLSQGSGRCIFVSHGSDPAPSFHSDAASMAPMRAREPKPALPRPSILAEVADVVSKHANAPGGRKRAGSPTPSRSTRNAVPNDSTSRIAQSASASAYQRCARQDPAQSPSVWQSCALSRGPHVLGTAG